MRGLSSYSRHLVHDARGVRPVQVDGCGGPDVTDLGFSGAGEVGDVGKVEVVVVGDNRGLLKTTRLTCTDEGVALGGGGGGGVKGRC